MNYMRLALSMFSIFLVAACSNSLGSDVNEFNGQSDLANISTGSVSDVTSPAHFQQVLGDRVFFAVDDSSLSIDAQAILDDQANWLLENVNYDAVIEGHADERGTREYNLALGARRANTVREYLISRGILETRLETISYGKERPIEICSNESCYALNRRVVTVLTSGVSG
ncbi:MAG: peptidoglycan-associated lipoprotein Pal [Aestuariivita sp.]|nr:peptidoglycan-associated lipoprotein Pal [Aestuariivita sp.]